MVMTLSFFKSFYLSKTKFIIFIPREQLLIKTWMETM